MSNNLLTLQKITNESLLVLENELTLGKQVNRQYENQFAQSGAKIGYTVNIRKPPRYQGRTGPNLNVEDSVETSVPLTIAYQEGVDLEFTDADMLMSIDDFSKRFIQPAVSQIANKVDMRIAALANQVSNIVGVPGTTPNTRSLILQAGKVLKQNAVRRNGGLRLVCDPSMEASMADTNMSLFNPQSNIGKIFETGEMGTALGFRWFMDQNIAAHTFAAGGGTPVVNGANQTGYTIVTSGWTPSTKVLFDGDVITFAAVNAVNPVGKQDLGYLKTFAVKGDVTSDSSGNATITLYTPIVPASGASVTQTFGPSPITLGSAHQNVTASPANSAAIALFAAGHSGIASPQNLAFHPDAITLACVDMPMVGGTDMCARVKDDQLGLSIRLVRDYLPGTDQRVTRLDILYGLAVVRPEWAVRIAG